MSESSDSECWYIAARRKVSKCCSGKPQAKIRLGKVDANKANGWGRATVKQQSATMQAYGEVSWLRDAHSRWKIRSDFGLQYRGCETKSDLSVDETKEQTEFQPVRTIPLSPFEAANERRLRRGKA